MKKVSDRIVPSELPMTAMEFLDSFNKNMPAGYPLATLEMMSKFKLVYPNLFKKPNIWSLDLHRKRMIEWLPQNI